MGKKNGDMMCPWLEMNSRTMMEDRNFMPFTMGISSMYLQMDLSFYLLLF